MRILFTTLGSLGDLYPYLALVREMNRRGHQATILTSSPDRLRIEQSGIRFQQIVPDLDFTDNVFQERAMREMSLIGRPGPTTPQRKRPAPRERNRP